MVSYSFYENDGRVKRYAETLAHRGDQVDVISLKKSGQPSFECLNGVNIYRVQERIPDEKGKFAYLSRILRFLVHSAFILTMKHFKNPYRLVHVHSIPDFEVFAAFLPKLFGSSVILDIHDVLPELYMAKFQKNTTSILFRLLIGVEKLSCSFADQVIISNHLWQKKLLSRSVDRKKCHTILNYPDSSIFYPRARTRNDGKFIMMYPGTVNWHQGLDLAINAFEMIYEEVSEAEFHIYGRGSELEELRSLVTIKNLKDRVLFKPLVPIERIAELMASADLGVIPKRNDGFGGEAFSTKSLEFMSVGVPLVMSDTKIDRYYFNDSIVRFFEAGNATSLASAMREMIKDEAMRNRISKNALKFVEDFSWEKKNQEYFDLVDHLTGIKS
jgi:glycosyltransferase involved in cell wall biosynthesis